LSGVPTHSDRFIGRAVPVVAMSAFLLAYTASGTTLAHLFLTLVGIWALRTRPADPAITRIGLWFIGLYVLVVAVDFANGDIGESIETTVAAYLPLLGILPAAAVMARAEVPGPSLDRVLAGTIVVGAVLNGILFLQADFPRAGGLGISPIVFGFAILSWAMLALARALEDWPRRAWLFGPVVLSFLPMALTGTRMVVICALIGFGVILLHWVIRGRRWALILPFGAVLIALVAVAGYAFRFRWQVLKNHAQIFIETGELVPGSFGARVEMLRLGIDAFRDAPLIGHGRSNQIAAALEQATPGSVDLSHQNTLHNDYLVHMVSFGVFGLVFMLAFLGLLVWIARGIADPALRGFGYAWTAMLAVFMLTNIAFNSGPMSGMVCFVAALLLAVRARPAPSA
jgi:O-antigen ligase